MDEIERLARLVLVLPRGSFPSISFGISDTACTLLASMDRAVRSVSVYDDGTAIEGVGVDVLGVEFRAQSESRRATAEEMARLVGAKERVYRSASYLPAVTVESVQRVIDATIPRGAVGQ
jgi:hypothetical protein